MMKSPQVICVVKRILENLKGDPNVHFTNRTTQIACDLEELTRDGLRTVYKIVPKINPGAKHFFELQMTEQGEKNVGQIITNMSGKKLIPRWRAKYTVGFRTSKGQFLAIRGYAVKQMYEILSYSLEVEGKDVYLVEESTTLRKARYDNSDDTWAIALPKELEQLADAVMSAMEKAECNCFKNGCQYHYALSEEEARKALAERHAKQRAAVETKTPGTPASETVETEEEEEGSAEELPASEPVIETSVPAPAVEPVTPAVETVTSQADEVMDVTMSLLAKPLTPAPVEPAVEKPAEKKERSKKPKSSKPKKEKRTSDKKAIEASLKD